MRARHTDTWLFTDDRIGDPVAIARRLPRGTGVVLRHHQLRPTERRSLYRRLQRVAASRGLRLVDEAGGEVARIHDGRELRRALGRRVPLIFVSALFPTRSHPGRPSLPRMRAATLARLTGGRALALGGMSGRRFRAVEALGFRGWGGIDAWATGPSRE